jgi:hypothetical protein
VNISRCWRAGESRARRWRSRWSTRRGSPTNHPGHGVPVG